jgi:hypothetical protein
VRAVAEGQHARALVAQDVQHVRDVVGAGARRVVRQHDAVLGELARGALAGRQQRGERGGPLAELRGGVEALRLHRERRLGAPGAALVDQQHVAERQVVRPQLRVELVGGALAGTAGEEDDRRRSRLTRALQAGDRELDARPVRTLAIGEHEDAADVGLVGDAAGVDRALLPRQRAGQGGFLFGRGEGGEKCSEGERDHGLDSSWVR